MDKWEDVMKQLTAMPAEKQQEQIDAFSAQCICGSCPTYKGTGEVEKLFCTTNKSEIIKDMKGCQCGLCPNVQQVGLTRIYYCMRGPEAEQRGVHFPG